MSSYRIMWIYWCLWMVLITKSCNGNSDTNFTIARVGSDTLTVLEGDDVTMTCEYDIDYDYLDIPRYSNAFTWFENVTSEELNNYNQYYSLTRDGNKHIVTSGGKSRARVDWDIDGFRSLQRNEFFIRNTRCTTCS